MLEVTPPRATMKLLIAYFGSFLHMHLVASECYTPSFIHYWPGYLDEEFLFLKGFFIIMSAAGIVKSK